MKVIGLIQLQDPSAFETYRSLVANTVQAYGGEITFRGQRTSLYWNELNAADFQMIVEINFKDQAAADSWAKGPEYTELIAIRSQAMKLTLFGVQ
jgi:uncharacterized protein (DUF1330 family)